MSSGPVGLDVREYVYQIWTYVVPDGSLHQIGARNQWLVTRVQCFAAAASGQLNIQGTPSPSIPLAANGCVTLEPNGAYRGDLFVQGQGAVLIVEFWIQANDVGPITVDIS